MTHLKKRQRAKTNASLISMVQRFSDITIMFGGLWLVCELSGLPFLYMHLLVALITLVVFQMLGGSPIFTVLARGQNFHRAGAAAAKLDAEPGLQRGVNCL